MSRCYLGLDPGQSGGIALLGGAGGVDAWKMPETERDLWELLRSIPGPLERQCFALIERVHSMPKQGVASSFKFGRSYGSLRMALIAAGIPFEEVLPQTWMKALGCLTRGNKNVTKAKAQQLFPAIKVTHALADALLIAEYARRLNERTRNVSGPQEA